MENQVTIKTAIIGLLKVKSLVTIMLTAVFAYLAVTGVITGEQTLTIYTVIISFYYGTQAVRKDGAV